MPITRGIDIIYQPHNLLDHLCNLITKSQSMKPGIFSLGYLQYLFAGTLLGRIRYRRPFFSCPLWSFGCEGSSELKKLPTSAFSPSGSQKPKACLSRIVSDHDVLATWGSSGPKDEHGICAGFP